MIYKRKTHTKKIIGLSLLLTLIFTAVGYDYLHAQSAAADSNLTAVNATSSETDQLIGVVNQINMIQLDGSIFQDPVFQSLQDDTVTLPTDISGRSNPFAPIGSVTTSAPKTTSTSKTTKK